MLILVGSKEPHFERRLMDARPVVENLQVSDVSRVQLEFLHRIDMPELRLLEVKGGVGLEDKPLLAASAGCRPKLERLDVRGLPLSTALSLARPCGGRLDFLALDVGTEQRVTKQLLEQLPRTLKGLALIRESEEQHHLEACQSQRDDLEQLLACGVECSRCGKVRRLHAP
jgi:hypothetical protein